MVNKNQKVVINTAPYSIMLNELGVEIEFKL